MVLMLALCGQGHLSPAASNSVTIQQIRAEVQRLGFAVREAQPRPHLRISKAGKSFFIECNGSKGDVSSANMVAGFHLKTAVEATLIRTLSAAYGGKIQLEFQLGGYVTASARLLGAKPSVSEIEGNLRRATTNLAEILKELKAYRPKFSDEIYGIGRAPVDPRYVLEGLVLPDIAALARASGWESVSPNPTMREWSDAAKVHGVCLQFVGGMATDKAPQASLRLVWMESFDEPTVARLERNLRKLADTEVYVTGQTIWANRVVSLNGGKTVSQVQREVESFADQVKNAKG